MTLLLPFFPDRFPGRPLFLMKAIPTKYKGVRFRSRLEARWAVLFDLMQWPWEYEPIDLEGYIPDFILPFERGPVLVEVKPAFSLEALRSHAEKIMQTSWRKEALIVGAAIPITNEMDSRVFGVMADLHDWKETCFNEENTTEWSPAESILCRKHEGIGFNDELMVWFCRVCGCGYKEAIWDDSELMSVWWADAGNEVQWRGKNA